MTISIRFEAGERWSHLGKPIRFERHLGSNLLYFMEEATLAPFQVELDDGRLGAPDVRWAAEAHAVGDLKRLRDVSGPTARRKAAERDIDPETARLVDDFAPMRAFLLRHLDLMPEPPRSDRAFRVVISKLWGEFPNEVSAFPRKPSPRAVRHWMDERGTPGDRPLIQMVSMSGRVERRRRIAPEVAAQVHQSVLWYWSSHRWTITDAYAHLRAALSETNAARSDLNGFPQLEPPSFETFRRAVHRAECFESVREKYGLRAANTRFKPCGKGLSATRILQVGAMDHTLLDGVAVIDAVQMIPVGRPWLTTLMDVYSRCIVGFVLTFEPPSLYSVMECIKRANRQKLHLPPSADAFPDLRNIFGRFDEIVVDNGKEFAGVAMEDALADIGTSLRLAPVASPTYKGAIERHFGTINTRLNRKLPGGVFKPEVLRELGYDPEKEAVLTVSELEELLWDFLVLYHITPQRGQGSPPAQLWAHDAERYGIPVIGDDAQLDKMLGAVKYPCLLSRSGVELFGLTFHDQRKVGSLLEDLVRHEPVRRRRKGSATARVKVKYNPASLSEIHVWNKETKAYVTLPCVDETYAQSVSLWHHRMLQKWAKERGCAYSTEADRLRVKSEMISKLQDISPTLKGKERRAWSRLMHSPKIQSLAGGDVTLAYAPPRHDGLAPIVPNDVLASGRSDDGRKPSRPPRSKKRTSAEPRRRRSIEDYQHLKPETGEVADYSYDLTTWSEADI